MIEKYCKKILSKLENNAKVLEIKNDIKANKYNFGKNVDLFSLNQFQIDSIVNFPDYFFDFIFIDSEKFSEIRHIFSLALKKLKFTGVFAGKNYNSKDVKDALKSFGLSTSLHPDNIWQIETKIGIVYVAWKNENHFEELIKSVKLSQFPTCLITDQDTIVPNNLFGTVIRTDFSEYQGLHHFYRKLTAIQFTPFDISLYLDADTFPLGDLSLGFAKANQFNFATIIAPGETFLWYDREYVHYNCGVLFFKGKPFDWCRQVLSHSLTFTESDEPAWSIAWHELDINVATLPETFNFVVAGFIHDRKVRIWHSRKPPHAYLTHQMHEIYKHIDSQVFE